MGLNSCTNCKPCGANNPYKYDTPEYWIQEWVGNSDDWFTAHGLASSAKMNPGTDAQTAAEHYIFMRGVQTSPEMPIFGALMTVGGGAATPLYQAIKAPLHKFMKTSKASMQQLEWGERGWHDGIRDMHGFMYDPAHKNYYSVSTKAGECR